MSDAAARPSFKKVLVADRGETAVRVIRACRELSLPSVAVYSAPDRDSLPVMLADEAVCIGPAPAQDSYHNVSRVLSAAEITGCDAVHPGTGALAESPEFADATESVGLHFIGPDAETIRRMRDKIAGRRLARDAGLAVVPGSEDEVADVAEATKLCAALGYPVMVKTAVGAGPKNKHVIRRDRDLETGFRMAQADAKAVFGDGRVYIEKFVPDARHVEVPVLADRHGNIVALPETDCSVQFRWRKLLEESPSPAIDADARARLREWATAVARAAGLTGPGVVEFIADASGNCHFAELDCRLHIEHPVTEMVTGVDVVRHQLLAAAGEELVIAEPGRFVGHAIECRINAEDPDAGFEPTTGLLTDVRFAGGPGVRVDSYIAAGYVVPPHYDSLLAKLVVWAPDRSRAIARLERALAETVVEGPATTLGLHRRLARSGRFRRGRLLIGMLDAELGP
jgi:acetyl-CoA carboxylase biotin carboxylase subunit